MFVAILGSLGQGLEMGGQQDGGRNSYGLAQLEVFQGGDKPAVCGVCHNTAKIWPYLPEILDV